MNVNSSLSGLYAAQAQLDVAGQNIANLSTQDYTRQQLRQSEAFNGGVNVTLTTSAAGAGNNLEADSVEQLQATRFYQANLAVVKANDDMLGTLIDIKA